MAKSARPQANASLDDWQIYLENLHSKAIELGLDRIRQVASRLNLLQPAPFVFTVGGTNGKGTTCRTLEVLLLAAGYRVGVYSSPHLLRYTERVRIQGQELTQNQHVVSLASLDQGRGETSLTYFEFSTLSALQLFKQAKLDVVILEVGLGGRLDATNIVDADVAVITSIALDHTDWLGADRESIGREKAGIFRAEKPAVVGEPDMPATIAQVASAINTTLLARDQQWQFTKQRQSWQFNDQFGVLNQLPLPKVPLANAATALAALRVSGLEVSEDIIRQALPSATLPGRFQIVSEAPKVILDVAHNPHAATYLAEQVRQLQPTGRVLGVVGMLHDKDIPGTLQVLSAVVDNWYCAALTGPRGASAEELQQGLAKASGYPQVIDAWRAALTDAKPEDIVLVCGSFHTVAAVMEQLAREENIG